jgi:hypothetical protein
MKPVPAALPGVRQRNDRFGWFEPADEPRVEHLPPMLTAAR